MIEDRKRTSKKELEALANSDDADFLGAIAEVCTKYIREADKDEDERRKADRVGANMFAGRQWDVRVNPYRTSLTFNYARSLIQQLVSLQTKQDPIWSVSPNDAGDVQGAQIMQTILPKVWTKDGMPFKIQNAMILGEVTRTCAIKTIWDESMEGWIGDVTNDVIPGYRLILDPRTSNPEQMRFIGDRAQMSRADAMLLYPDAAEMLEDAGDVVAGSAIAPPGGGSPFKDQFARSGGTGNGAVAFSNGGAVVNGQPVVTAYTGRDPSSYANACEIEIIELYHRDASMHWETVPIKDHRGNTKQKMVMDDEDSNMPKFEQTGDYDDILEEQGYQLVYEDETERKLMPDYPFWRRTTMLSREGVVLEDIAWDHPQPYQLYMADAWLEGPWCKGTIMSLLEPQLSLNVSLSIMQDNLYFGSHRVFKRTSNSPITRNSLAFAAGQVIDVGDKVGNLEALEFPQMNAAWFQWIETIKKFMREMAGVDGIMSGSAGDAPRTDNSKGFDTLAELGGSRISSKILALERFIQGIGKRNGYWIQKNYTEAHAVTIEDMTGELTWERATSALLMGSFNYDMVCGSTTAWSGSGMRARVMEDKAAGLRDNTSVCKALDSTAYAIADWKDVKKRAKMAGQNWDATAPPPRTRAAAPKQQKKK